MMKEWEIQTFAHCDFLLSSLSLPFSFEDEKSLVQIKAIESATGNGLKIYVFLCGI
jgi:hypothetical protein